MKNTAMDTYNGINNDIYYWKQYIKIETVNVISDVWDDAQSDIQGFIDDWKWVFSINYVHIFIDGWKWVLSINCVHIFL